MTYGQCAIWLTERQMVSLGPLRGMAEKPKAKKAKNAKKRELPMRKEDVKIGHFCGGSCVKECGAMFGEALWQACRTCPD